jgi:uncharacterized protein YcgI (DUF1989 family)
MATVSNEIFIPAGHARAFIVRRGETFRLLQVEGEQVADAVFFNAHDYRETFHAGHTAYLACIEGTGNIKRVKKLYSKPPRENVMFTVTDDPVGVHFAFNLAEAIASYGLTPDDVPDVFNIWMNVDLDPNGCFIVKPPVAKKDDYIEFRAEMDCLAAISACPSDIAPVNNFRIKPLKVEIYG